MFDKSEIISVIGQTLYTEDGTKVGKIGQVYLDEVHDQPSGSPSTPACSA